MSIAKTSKLAHLRLGPEAPAQTEVPLYDGVLVWLDVPVGAVVNARVLRPATLLQVDEAAVVASQPYKFELAPPPAAFTAGGVTFDRRPFASVPPNSPEVVGQSSLQRVLVVGGNGPVDAEQREPIWADFAAAVTGDLVRMGKTIHQMVMPGHPTLTPNLPPEQRNLLRMRWTGTVVAAAVLAAPAGDTESEGNAWASDHRNLVPGSIVLTLPTAGTQLRDTGKGRLVGPDGDGVVDYVTGAFRLKYDQAETGNVTADYEHDCGYQPLDVDLSFDPLDQ